MKLNKRSAERGITLVALVITVIVLLILAGTTVTIAINSGDIFTKANTAKSEWNAAVAEEEAVVQNHIDMLEDY